MQIYTVNKLGRGMEKPVPTELESWLQRLLGEVQEPKPEITDLETLLQGLLPGIPAPAPRARPGPIRRDWAMIVCFSCGKAGHGVGRCPELNERFHFMLPGWSAEKVGDSNVMISPRVAAERRRGETWTDPGWGVSWPDRPHDPGGDAVHLTYPRDVGVSRPVIPPIVRSETLHTS